MKKNKDVLILCQFFYPEYISSATLPYDTAKALVESGLSVGTICGYPKEYNNFGKVPLKEESEGISIKRVRYVQIKRSNFIGRLINYFSFTFFVTLRFLTLKNYKTIVVYSNPPILPLIAALASKLFGTKMIFVSYDIYPEIAQVTNVITDKSIISKIMIEINKLVFKYVYKVVALSNEMKAYLIENRSSLKTQQVEVIPNWYKDVELQNISIAYKNDKFVSLNPSETFIVSYFGNMGIAQDLDTIIEALRIFKYDDQVKFIFAGHGKKVNHLKDIIKTEELRNVTVYDFLHGQDFEDALNISDCCIVSLADGLAGLAVPSKAYSYMMASKPVIAIMSKDTDIVKDILDNDAGYSMEVGEVSKLVSAIKDLKNDDVKQKIKGFNSRKVFLEKYTKEICTKQYIDMIKNVLEV